MSVQLEVDYCILSIGLSAIQGVLVLCTAIPLIAGALLGVLLYHFIIRAQSKPKSQAQKPVPMYEDVQNITPTGTEGAAFELKPNEAYGPLRWQEITTKLKEACGHVKL